MKMFPNLNMLHIICFALLYDLCLRTKAELFSAVVELEPLVETHQRVIEDLGFYIDNEKRRLEILERFLNEFKKEHKRIKKDIPGYLGSPTTAFAIIKRLTTDLDHIKLGIKMEPEYKKNLTLNHNTLKYPTTEDLIGAARALVRLQDIYHLKVSDLAEGKIYGPKSTPMSASDCFVLGRVLYNEKDYENSRVWMKEVLRKMKGENISHLFSEKEVKEFIRSKKSIVEEKMRNLHQGENDMDQHGNSEPVQYIDYTTDKKVYSSLCRGKGNLPLAIAKRLKCRYLREKHSFLKLAPIKMEMLYRNPDIVMFHDVLSNEEVKMIKKLAKPRLKRALVRHRKTGEKLPTFNRTSKSMWLRDTESETVARISRRVSHITGLNINTAEDLQVANYGIGGHYDPHFDFTTVKNVRVEGVSERIATVLFYLSDVVQGGATVFTQLGLRVIPKKRAALYWMNVLPSGEGDLDTRHAACPVLQGSKWVSTKWIRANGQELLKPCYVRRRFRA